jgi:Na+-transporting NADH:ubiquinone oxidoreductase subunit C
MKRDSIANTIIVALGLCLVCSFLVSFAAVGPKERQERNALLDRKRNILAAAGLVPESA